MRENIVKEEQKNEIVLDKVDIKIIYSLYVNKKVNSLQSYKIKQIQEYNKDLNLAYYTYSLRIKKLIKSNIINEGTKDGNARTFYITKEGINYIENNVIDNMDLEEYEEE